MITINWRSVLQALINACLINPVDIPIFRKTLQVPKTLSDEEQARYLLYELGTLAKRDLIVITSRNNIRSRPSSCTLGEVIITVSDDGAVSNITDYPRNSETLEDILMKTLDELTSDHFGSETNFTENVSLDYDLGSLHQTESEQLLADMNHARKSGKCEKINSSSEISVKKEVDHELSECSTSKRKKTNAKTTKRTTKIDKSPKRSSKARNLSCGSSSEDDGPCVRRYSHTPVTAPLKIKYPEENEEIKRVLESMDKNRLFDIPDSASGFFENRIKKFVPIEEYNSIVSDFRGIWKAFSNIQDFSEKRRRLYMKFNSLEKDISFHSALNESITSLRSAPDLGNFNSQLSKLIPQLKSLNVKLESFKTIETFNNFFGETLVNQSCCFCPVHCLPVVLEKGKLDRGAPISTIKSSKHKERKQH